VRISPDGSRLLYYVDSGSFDVWSWDLGRKVKIPQTFGAAHQTSSIFPIWSPDGRRIAFTLVRNGKYSLAIKEADGSDTFEEVVEGVERYRFAADWSPDGGTLVYSEGHQEGHAIWMLRLEGERRPHRFLEGPFSTREPKFSPDGRWIAYVSNEPGEYNVFVAPFPGPGGRWQVSSQGGTNPRWRRDGKEIFFVSADDRIVAADITTHGSTIEVGPVRPLFLVRTYGVFSRLDVAADGQSFVVPREPGSPGTALALVSGWPAIGRR
jgi:Tol biopolymer transport system component